MSAENLAARTEPCRSWRDRARKRAAQQTDKPFDFKPLLPPVVPVPPNSAVTSGSVGGTQNPYTTAPLQSPTQAPTQAAPGMRLTFPSR